MSTLHPSVSSVTVSRGAQTIGKIFQGDCLDIMKTFPSERTDFVLTDPPYLVNFRDRAGRTIKNDVHSDWVLPAYAESYRVLKPNRFCVSFFGWNAADIFLSAWKKAGFRVLGNIVWTKPYTSGKRFLEYRHESAYLLGKGDPPLPKTLLPSVLPWKYSGNTWHPTEKAIEVLAPLIEVFSPPDGIVLDPFMGSGSTCLAAKKHNRKFVGIELDPDYYEQSKSRLLA